MGSSNSARESRNGIPSASDAPRSGHEERPDRGPRDAGFRRWELWRLPASVVAGVLAVDAAAVVLAVLAVAGGLRSIPLAAAGHLLPVAGVLVVGAVGHIEIARHADRRRELDSIDLPYVDLKSMWSFAALLALPLGWALGLVTLQWAVWWWRMPTRPLPHRWTFSWAAVVLASVASAAVLHGLDGPPPFALDGPRALLVVALAALVRWTVNHGLTSAVVARVARRSGSWAAEWLRRVVRPAEAAVGLTALALGVLLAVLVGTAPWAVPVLMVPLLLVHRGLVLQHVIQRVHRDDKTGLVTAARWHRGAERIVATPPARRHGLGVLMVDVDEFKRVNDRYGHLAGDAVLRAVATVLSDEVRDEDAVGRFGGEEFVVLVRDAGPDAAAEVAERLRRRVRAVSVPCPVPSPDDGAPVIRGLSVSIGVATFPGAGSTVDDLLLAADTALYVAKRDGRDRVRIAPPALPA